jgi:hypothetical protein
MSKSKPQGQDGRRAALIDFRGFLDIRYTILCAGTFFAILGLWIPSYYISAFRIAVSNFQHLIRQQKHTQTLFSRVIASASTFYAS